MKIDNLKVYDLQESIIASGYPMVVDIDNTREVTDKDISRCLNLTKASNGNGAHGQWMTGVRVAFDLTCSNKMWIELERYRFLEFVSSQSTMHRITKFNLDKCFNQYVDSRIINVVKEKVDKYNALIKNNKNNMLVKDENTKEEEDKAYLRILYNIPAGIELIARITTDYRCLLNVYIQRYNHRLPEWREFCDKLLELPLFKELVDSYISKEKNNG